MPGYEVSWNCYDRLISHEMKTVNGVPYYDRDKFKMELAEDMNVGDDVGDVQAEEERQVPGRHAGQGAGREVVARPRRHRSAASRPSRWAPARWRSREQFVVVDDNTIRVDFIRKDRLTIPDLAVIVPAIYNSGLVKKNATEKDPWGLEYTKLNTAGSGAYKVVALDRRHRSRHGAQRRLGRRSAAARSSA